jgi:membrane protease YdiL (CAAX protease family)
LLIAGIIMELALLIAAHAIGWAIGVSPFAQFRLDLAGVVYGLAATGPMVLLLLWCLQTRWAPIRRLVTLVEDQVGPHLADTTLTGIIVLSLLAGIGEEALFRGVIQGGLDRYLPAWAAIAIAALLFGMGHWLTRSYALLAALIGVYLGLLFVIAGNLLVPTVAHAAYDMVALSVLLRRVR